ncbi:MAG TPA: antibiotic biosynthesis monooxygenase [Streptosporangiales bacterium]
MIARVWKAWASRERADAYEHLLRSEILPELDAVEGCHGAYVLRRDDVGPEVEFLVLHLFESLDAVMRFAGDPYEAAVVPEAARTLLARFETTAEHYGVRSTPHPRPR